MMLCIIAAPIVMVVHNIKRHFAFDELLDFEKKQLFVYELICNLIGIFLISLIDNEFCGRAAIKQTMYLHLQYGSLSIADISYPLCALPFGLIAYFYLKYTKVHKSELKNLALLISGAVILAETAWLLILSVGLSADLWKLACFFYYALVPVNYIITAGSEWKRQTGGYIVKLNSIKERTTMNENNAILEQNTVFTENITEKPQDPDAPKFKIIFTAALIAAFLFTLCFKGADVTAGLSSVIFFNITAIGGVCVLKLFGSLRKKGGLFILLPIALLSAFNAYYEYSYYNVFNCIAFFVLFTCMMLYCAGIEKHPALDSILDSVFNKMLVGTNRAVVSSVKVDGLQLFKVVVGIAVSMPFIAVIGYLLATGDDAFFDAMSSLLDVNGWSIAWTIIVFIAIFMYACGFLYKFLYNEKRIVFDGIDTDKTIAVSFLTPVNLLFAFFCCSQLRYFFGDTPVSEFTTYSRFAREGFFQLLIVTFINFSIILVFTDILKTKTKGLLKGSLVMLCIFTFVLIISSFYRMYLYIDAYGYTPLRIEVISFLAAETVLVFTTVYALLYNRTNILHTFVIAAAAALISLNVTARPEFSLSLNNDKPTDMSVEYTHSELPLLINGYYAAQGYAVQTEIKEKITALYNEEDTSKHNWQSANVQKIYIQSLTESFLNEEK